MHAILDWHTSFRMKPKFKTFLPSSQSMNYAAIVARLARSLLCCLFTDAACSIHQTQDTTDDSVKI